MPRANRVVDLANFLNSMGANISGAGTDVIKIRGVEHLKGHYVFDYSDQIEAGIVHGGCGCNARRCACENVTPKHLESITAKLMEMGVTVVEYDDAVRVRCDGPLSKCNVKRCRTGLPDGSCSRRSRRCSPLRRALSIFKRGVWENRFHMWKKLKRMGAGSP